MIQVERTDFVSVPVTDLERATRFYEETLGLPRIPGPGNALILHWRYAPHAS